MTPTAARPAMITPGQSISFTAPATAETLQFEMTAIDPFGAAGTSFVDVTTQTTAPGGGGSSALSLYFILCLAAVAALRRRRLHLR